MTSSWRQRQIVCEKPAECHCPHTPPVTIARPGCIDVDLRASFVGISVCADGHEPHWTVSAGLFRFGKAYYRRNHQTQVVSIEAPCDSWLGFLALDWLLPTFMKMTWSHKNIYNACLVRVFCVGQLFVFSRFGSFFHLERGR